ncbi:subclass B3 metallo-beta-lactamase [Sphingopyxis sp. MWB1]|uniref:subclass B3 metallo-beta-lactamase n=1 Tax=Sphingopyxis sp. MWB1 TaxID=1537715 RepID=UPI00051A11F0|nr:subclass B3 metallo-beta-lactamase [Sphingopyxis sp. MWB1]
MFGATMMMAGLAAMTAAMGHGHDQADDPLTRPVPSSYTEQWLAPVPPEKLFGNSYLVGFGGLSVALIDTGDGLILVDGAMPQSAPDVLANVRKLGFDPKDIKFILSTEPHFDHGGGIPALARDTGATVLTGARGVKALKSGRLDADDPQLSYDHSFPGVAAPVRAMRDGEVLALGDARITAHATPGHTMASMSWSWPACEADNCRTIVFAASLNAVSGDDYRYSAPESAPIVAGFAHSFAVMKTIPCDLLITSHPAGADKRYIDAPGACRTYAEQSQQRLEARLLKERGEAGAGAQ